MTERLDSIPAVDGRHEHREAKVVPTIQDKAVLESIVRLFCATGQVPTVRAIADDVGLKSTSTVFTHVKALRMKGFLRQGRGRGIALSDRTLVLVVNLMRETFGVKF